MKYTALSFLILGSMFTFRCVTPIQKNTHPMKSQWFIAGETPVFQGKKLGYAGPSAGVNNDALLVVGGANFPDKAPWYGGAKQYYNLVYVYQPQPDGTLLPIKDTVLQDNIAYAATCTTPHGVALLGGENENGPTNQAMVCSWQSGVLHVTSLPVLPQKVTNAQAAYADGKIYFAGGEDASQTYQHFWCLDLNNLNDGWQSLTDLPQATSNAVLLRAKKQLYLVGGRKKNAGAVTTFYSQVYAYNMAQGIWEEKAHLPYPLAAHTGVAAENQLLVFSGDKGIVFNQTETLIHEINATHDDMQKQKLIAQKAHLQESHPGFTKEVLSYDLAQDRWRVLSASPYAGQVTATATRLGKTVYIVNGEIRAGVRTPQITGFVIDN